RARNDPRLLVAPPLSGAALGAAPCAFVPEDQLTAFAGANIWWAVPVAAIIGIPLYIRLETMLPIGLALHSAGVALGPIFALMLRRAGASPPEVSNLTAVLQPRLVVSFHVPSLAP